RGTPAGAVPRARLGARLPVPSGPSLRPGAMLRTRAAARRRASVRLRPGLDSDHHRSYFGMIAHSNLTSREVRRSSAAVTNHKAHKDHEEENSFSEQTMKPAQETREFALCS